MAPIPRIAGAVALGLAAGGLLSVAPLKLFTAGLACSCVAAFVWAATRGSWQTLAVQVVSAAAVMFAAHAVHNKYVDQPLERALPTQTPTVAQLEEELFGSRLGENGSADTRVVHLTSVRPTRREIDDALEPLGLRLNLVYCGTGATLLWGPFPLGMGEITEASPARRPPLR